MWACLIRSIGLKAGRNKEILGLEPWVVIQIQKKIMASILGSEI